MRADTQHIRRATPEQFELPTEPAGSVGSARTGAPRTPVGARRRAATDAMDDLLKVAHDGGAPDAAHGRVATRDGVGEGEPRWVRLDAIHAAPHQPRLAGHAPEAVRNLAASIWRDTLLSRPQVRPHGTKPDAYEIVAGHGRVAALHRVAALVLRTGTPHPAVQPGPTVGESRIPVLVAVADDDLARRRAVVENSARTGLRRWEEIVAVSEHVGELRARGQHAEITARRVMRALGLRRWVADAALRVVAGLTPEVLHRAGLLPRPDAPLREAHAQAMMALELEPLDQIARLPEVSARVDALRQACRGGQRLEATHRAPERGATASRSLAGSGSASPDLGGVERQGGAADLGAAAPISPAQGAPVSPSDGSSGEAEPNRRGSRGGSVADRGLVIDIRVPLATLSPSRARSRVLAIAPALAELLVRAERALTSSDLAALRPAFGSMQATLGRLETRGRGTDG